MHEHILAALTGLTLAGHQLDEGEKELAQGYMKVAFNLSPLQS